jgi:proline dehydrogenase
LDKERQRAKAHHLPSPVLPNKEATDQAFDRGVQICLDNLDGVEICAATHHIGSVRKLLMSMHERRLSPSDPRISSAQLLGMFDRLSVPLATKGYNVSKYVPYGPVRKVIPYLLRRAEENRSVAAQSGSELAAIEQELKRRSKS